MSNSFESLFNPDSIAVIGASAVPGKVGYRIVENIISKNYKGKLHLVNPKGGMILEHEAVRGVEELPENIDTAIITTPKKSILPLVEECVKHGLKNLVVFTAGFREMGAEGKADEARLKELLANSNTRLIGPNCGGYCNPSAGLHATFEIYPKRGKVALVSQSGSICSVVTSNLAAMNIGISKYISLGNKLNVNEVDILDYLADDPETEVIVMYLEDVDNGKALMESAKRVSLKKPVVVMKTGRTKEGAQATLSHTGALAGNDKVADGAFKQMGLIRVDTLRDLFNVTGTILKIKDMANNELAILSDAGGPGVIAADAASSWGLKVSRTGDKARAELKAVLPDIASVVNPIDITFTRDISLYAKSIAILENQGYGAMLVTIPSHFDIKDEHVEWMSRVRKESSLPLAVAWLCADEVEPQKRRLWDAGVPAFDDPADAVYCLSRVYFYSEWKRKRTLG